ncbi:MAG TPA: GAF domain-containing protein [Ilumatobacter sp.]|nr:GAF domain-containing protein [Ilumatobacter sp.]
MSTVPTRAGDPLAALAVYGDGLARATTLEEVVDAALAGLADLCGCANALLLVHQPELARLVTVGSHGYAAGGTGSEVALGEGVIGMVGARRQTMRIGNLQRMLSYARSVRRSAEDHEDAVDEIRLPGLADARSQLAAPMLARGALVGVLAMESSDALAYDEVDEQVLTIAAHLVAAAFEREQLAVSEPEVPPPSTVGVRPAAATPAAGPGEESVVLRHYAVDGSTFLDDDYMIKGVAGRLLWKLVADHAATGRTSFTNREAKLDPTLELPEYRDNFESRLILLKRRLDEQVAPVRIHSTGRGRFDIEVRAPLDLQHIAAT